MRARGLLPLCSCPRRLCRSSQGPRYARQESGLRCSSRASVLADPKRPRRSLRAWGQDSIAIDLRRSRAPHRLAPRAARSGARSHFRRECSKQDRAQQAICRTRDLECDRWLREVCPVRLASWRRKHSGVARTKQCSISYECDRSSIFARRRQFYVPRTMMLAEAVHSLRTRAAALVADEKRFHCRVGRRDCDRPCFAPVARVFRRPCVW